MSVEASEIIGKKVLVTQTRSLSGRNKRVRATMSSLGLGKISSKKEHVLTESTHGMLVKVRHLVKVEAL